MSAPISSVVVAGGGIVGWSAAAALRRRLPLVEVTVVDSPPPADSLADRLGCTLPSITDFHSDLRLGEADSVVRAGSGFRLGTRFCGWGGDDYVHGYGDHGRPLGPAPFHQHWLRADRLSPLPQFGEFAAAAAMGTAGRFAHPDRIGGAARDALPEFGYGLHVAPPRYREMVRALALHLGARARPGTVVDVSLRGDGFVEALRLDDGTTLSGDLFIDSTGPEARVRSALGGERCDWSGWFVADRLVVAAAPPDAGRPPPLLDEAIAFSAGWRWTADSPVRSESGAVYSHRHLADPAELGIAGEPVTLRPGRWEQPWLRNCLAIGDSAVAVEPLEWANLHLAHSAIDRLVAMLPDRDCDPVELWDYNRQASAEADRVRDFLLLHYALASRPGEPFWEEVAARPLPDSLQHSLFQFRERGRLPFYEEETFARDSWAAVMIGQGVRPRRIDPLIEGTPAADSQRSVEALHSAIARAVASLPLYPAYDSAFRRAER